MRVMRLREKVSKFVVVTMASALVISSMFTDYGFATHANETVDPNAPDFASVSDSDNIMMAAEPVPLYNYASPTNNFAKTDLSNPFLFAIYANKITRSDHVEGNMAVGALNGGMSIWGSSRATGDSGVSYIGDLSAGSFVCNVNGNYIVIPEVNPLDGISNKMVEAPGQGYRLCRINADNVEVGSFITDNKVYGFSYQNDIMSSIASTISAKAALSNELYNLPDMDTDSALVLNVTAEEVAQHEGQIVTAADGGKTVIVNVTSGGAVALPHMNANGVSDGSEYAAWAGRILWNLGNASSVSTGRVWGFILAPNASVANGNNIIGGVIANSFEQTGEVHQVFWIGVIPPPPTPTPEPTPEPPVEPTPAPTAEPTPGPTAEPTPGPTAEPTPGPTAEPTPGPTPEPTTSPTPNYMGPTPTPEPTPSSTPTPTAEPTP
ncbi:MAG: choice-of-anchor A family protein, partial [Acetatifactor sp.]|nr:choice-of-anchor A family protein [Acetatifactor sp.]